MNPARGNSDAFFFFGLRDEPLVTDARTFHLCPTYRTKKKKLDYGRHQNWIKSLVLKRLELFVDAPACRR